MKNSFWPSAPLHSHLTLLLHPIPSIDLSPLSEIARFNPIISMRRLVQDAVFFPCLAWLLPMVRRWSVERSFCTFVFRQKSNLHA